MAVKISNHANRIALTTMMPINKTCSFYLLEFLKMGAQKFCFRKLYNLNKHFQFVARV